MQADLAWHKFIILVGELHLLSHLSASVLNWGPLWAHSNFIFEGANGMLLKLFHGTQAVPKQICTSFLTTRIVKRVYERRALNLPESACEIIDRCLNIGSSTKNARIFGGTVCLGSSIIKHLSVQ